MLPLSDTEVTCVAATGAYLIIGYQGKKVAIYEVGGDLAAPKTTIDTSTVPSELLIYNDNICVCF